jgi:hypothetical protein
MHSKPNDRLYMEMILNQEKWRRLDHTTMAKQLGFCKNQN